MNESDIPVILGSKIGVQSMLSSKDKRGWVTFHWGPMSGRLTPDMAREHAFKILACAQAAQTDEMLWRFAHEVEEKDAMMLAVTLIKALREMRDVHVDHAPTLEEA